MTPKYPTHTYINTYSINTYTFLSQALPVSWIFEGQTQEGKWILLDIQKQYKWTIYPQTQSFIFTNNQCFIHYRFILYDYASLTSYSNLQTLNIYKNNFESISNTSNVSNENNVNNLNNLETIILSYTSIEYSCKAYNKYSQGIESYSSYKSCVKDHSVGYMTALCSHQHYILESNNCHLLSSSFFIYPQSIYYFEFDSDIHVITPSIIDSEVTYSIIPSLPDGLMFNTITGQISGHIRNPLVINQYTINVQKRNTQFSWILSLYSITPHCYPIDDYPETSLDDTIILLCNHEEMEGSRSRSCLWNTSLHTAEWTDEMNTCHYIQPSIQYPVTSLHIRVHETIDPILPTVNHYYEEPITIEPTLPHGLSLNSKTGEISGSPETITSDYYIITIKNPSDFYQTGLSITVVPGFCEEDHEWISTSVGTILQLDCIDTKNYEGYRERECLDYTFTWSPIRNHCQLKLPFISYVNTYIEGYINEYISSMKPIIHGGNLYPLEIHPSLPSTITFDTKTGEIYGILRDSCIQKKYTITAYNDRSSFKTVIYITVHKPICSQDHNWPETPLNTIVTLPCISDDYEGFYERQCSSYNHGTWGPIIDRCVLKEPILIYPQSTIHGYKFESIHPLLPSFKAGPIYEFTVYPSLPASISINAINGELYGKPLSVMNTTYTISLRNPRSVVFVDIHIMIQPRMCSTIEEWTAIEVNTISYLSCEEPNYYDGYRERECQYNKHHQAVWSSIRNHCQLKYPSIVYPQQIYTLYTEDSIEPIIPFIEGLYISSITIQPTLPKGLFFNATNGIIYGIPSTKDITLYSITVTNTRGSVSVLITLNISLSQCPQDSEWPETSINHTSILPCEDDEHYEGYRERNCLSIHHGTWSTIINHCLLKYPSIYYSPASLILYKGEDMIPAVPILFGLNITNLVISPDLPIGLFFDSISGVISGKPNVSSIHPITYSVFITNPRGLTISNITISVQLLYCESHELWAKTEAGKECIQECPDTANYSGYLSRDCLYENHGSWGSIHDHCILNLLTIQYPNNNTYMGYKNESIHNFVPLLKGLFRTELSISPSLPTVFFFNESNGAITGLPLTSYSKNHTIKGCNPSGCTYVSVYINIQIAYCYDEYEWPQTEVYTSVVLPCFDSIHYEGNRTRTCLNINHGTWDQIQDYCHLLPPTIHYPHGFVNGFKNKQIQPQIPEIFGGSIQSINISPSLPNGLFFNRTDGSIYGIPYETVFSVFSITIMNDAGSYSDYITLSINTFMCQQDGIWPVTEINTTVTRDCKDTLNYEGSIQRTCLSSPNGKWSNVLDTCHLKPLSLSYFSSEIIGYVDDLIPIQTPSFSGGLLSTFTITPSLENGLHFDIYTGSIQGTPIRNDTTSYIITLYNMNGDSIHTTLSFNIQYVYCEQEDVWNRSRRSSTVYMNCSVTEIGYKSRTCQYSGYGSAQWSSVMNTCTLLPPSIYYEASAVKGYVNHTIINIKPILSGESIKSVDVYPSLPIGLKMNNLNGSITGMASEMCINTFTIVVTNTQNMKAITSLFIHILDPSCPQDNSWKSTIVGNTIIQDCENPFLFDGSRSRACVWNEVSQQPEWTTIQNTCQYKIPTISYPQSLIHIFYDDYVNTITPYITGNNYTLSISPSIPIGLSFNEYSGSITGIPIFPSQHDLNSFFMNSNENSIVEYTITISNGSGSSSCLLSLHLEDVYCLEDLEWPMTRRSDTVVLRCSEDQIGEKRRTCLYGGYGKALWSIVTDSCKENLSIFDYSQHSIEVYVDDTIPTLIPILSGTINSLFTVKPSLPHGIHLDSQTGILSGVFYEPISQNYTIFVTINSIQLSTSISFTSQSVYCSAENEWNQTNRYQMISLPCEDSKMIGLRSRECLYAGNGRAIWSNIYNDCQYDIPDIVYSQSIYEFFINDTIVIYPISIMSKSQYTISISPSILNCITFNVSSGSFNGIACETLSQFYTITITNEHQSHKIDLLLNIRNYGCPQDGEWEETSIGITRSHLCANTEIYEGTLQRTCLTDHNGTWSTIMNTCNLRKPSIQYPHSIIQIGCDEPIVSLTPIIKGINIKTIIVQPPFPEGLTIDAKTASISGSISNPIHQMYTIYVHNSAGIGSTNITLYSFSVVCPTEGIWPTTIRNSIAYANCPIGQVGSQSRHCLYSGYNKAVWSQPDVTDCTYESTFTNPTYGHVFVIFPVYIDGINSYQFNNLTISNLFKEMLSQNISSYGISKNSILLDNVNNIARHDFSENQIRIQVKVDLPDSSYTDELMQTISRYINTPDGLLMDCQNSTNPILQCIHAVNTDINEFKNQTNTVDYTLFYFVIIIAIIVLIANVMISLCMFCVADRTMPSCIIKRKEDKTSNDMITEQSRLNEDVYLKL